MRRYLHTWMIIRTTITGKAYASVNEKRIVISLVGKFKVPWNSIEFHGTREYGKSSMEFHGTLDLDKIPWNSMELEILWLKFQGIPGNHRCCSNNVKKSSIGHWRKFHGIFFLSKWFSMSVEKRFWMIFWYVLSNAANAYGIMQILIMKHKLVKEIYKKIEGAYQFTEINSFGKIEYNFHQNLETQTPRNYIQI